ncbi:MAG TPA: DUF6293 family protein [Candidatus Bathyarchaeia archaeon]|nr:DUF6293 family protein [Candidatus Bathyarchaeia archaeon]
MLGNLRIHITPVGYEFRRVTEPLVRMQADKVYLVTYRTDDSAKKYFASVKKELLQNYKHIQVEEVFVDIWDLYECLERFRSIVTQERAAGNFVYINVSTGTKVTAMAGMLACMLWGASPYYAPVSYPSARTLDVPPTEHVEDPETFPVYEIRKPRPDQLKVLGMLKANSGKMRKAKLIEELESARIIGLRDETKISLSASAKHSQLRAILNPMEREWNFIVVESSGRRSDVFLTEKGETALKIFGASTA